MSRFVRLLSLPTLSLLLGMAVLVYQRHSLVEGRRHLAELDGQVVEARHRLAALQTEDRRPLKPTQQRPAPGALQGSLLEDQGRQNATDAPSTNPDASIHPWNDDSPYLYLRKRHLAKMAIPALTSENLLTETIMDALGMDDQERRATADAIAKLTHRFQQLERESIVELDEHPERAQQHHGTKTTFLIPRMEDTRQRLQGELEGSLTTILGSERAQIFLGHADSAIRENLNHFGKTARTITFVDDDNEIGTEPNHRVIMQTLRDDGTVISTYDRSSSDGEIPANVRHLITVQ